VGFIQGRLKFEARYWCLWDKKEKEKEKEKKSRKRKEGKGSERREDSPQFLDPNDSCSPHSSSCVP